MNVEIAIQIPVMLNIRQTPKSVENKARETCEPFVGRKRRNATETVSLAGQYSRFSPWSSYKMSNPSERSPDSFEQPLMVAHSLMRQKRGAEACRFLRQAVKQALSDGMSDDAALYSSVRGSYLVAMGRDAEALEAYLQAEQLSGGNTHYSLGAARHLASAMDRPGQALEIVDAILSSETESPSVRQEAHAIRGLAFLGLDQPEQAIKELQAIRLALSQLPLPALSCDLTLVEELSRQHLAPNYCRQYLRLVESVARENREGRILDQLVRLHTLLPDSEPPPADGNDL